ncbi:MAG TPA: tetratricopeptide repeat protein [Candidatus Binatia bacterium]|nr:tetratricopeptide repeat protein [Candidatus Binatia bacterium]
MSAALNRGLMLYEQNRYELAEAEFRQVLAHDPEDAFAHAFLGLCLAERKEYRAATEHIERAVHLAPDMALAHSAHSRILFERNYVDPALRAIHEAIRLEPENADYHAQESAIYLEKSQWREALNAAEQGLQIDPEHVTCTNLRALAMVKLGNRAGAGQTIGAALARNPEDAFTHANQGWALLHEGNPNKAMEHFREALRLEPNNEWARQGIVEALKARYFIYSIMLKWFLWMSRLPPNAQWLVLIGGWFGVRILRGIAKASPQLAPVIYPILILYTAFALMTWIASPLFNLLLRLNRFGRLALSREETIASNWLGVCMALALAMLGWWAVTQVNVALLGAMVFGFLLIPLAGTFYCESGWPRWAMAGGTAVLAALGIGALAIMWSNQPGTRDTGGSLFGLFLLGAILSTWIGNALRTVRPRR